METSEDKKQNKTIKHYNHIHPFCISNNFFSQNSFNEKYVYIQAK